MSPLENVGRVKWDEFPLKRPDFDGDDFSGTEEPPAVPETFLQRTVKLLKILLPHVGLNILLLTYIATGACIFIWLEADNELRQREQRLTQILSIYRMIINETSTICASADRNPSTIERRMRPLLSVLSRTHEYDERFTRDAQMWTDSEDELSTKWTFAAASLYALTVITSTGYDHLTPTTDLGRIFTVFYGLLGIPLMFITAADIGKFLSELVIRFYGKLLAIIAWFASVMDAIKDYLTDAETDSIDSRSFVHGLFFSFNTITTIGLGNIRVRSNLYLALTVCYVIIGLAVITASLDLCSSTLKRTFKKLHYFGRQIRGARRGFANVGEDFREAMKIMAALKKTRPSKERITLEDLKRFLEVQEQFLRQPYVPYNVHIFKWIEDAYAQYLEDTASVASKSLHKGTTANHDQSQSLLF
ncbi:Twik (KCNK-like) family of potassium channelsalpha subunit 17 [Aphelenchoides avenae]|nr:Twik (KCNK-like) family of potassium channelsalpha subunit 17 [Aphelenchus avenae]